MDILYTEPQLNLAATSWRCSF